MLRGRYRCGKKMELARTFENIIFLAEVFTEKSDPEVPNVPILELARSFELSRPSMAHVGRRQRKSWVLWD